jgi:hypothetical protein
MSVFNTNTCPCPPQLNNSPHPNLPCPPVYAKCPVVCKNSTFTSDDGSEKYTTGTSLAIAFIKVILNILTNPELLCENSSLGPGIVSIERCVIPFTGQLVTTITIKISEIIGGGSEADVKIQVFEKCNTWWFKIPNVLLLDPTYALEYPGSVGSVSITKSVECPTTYTGRILIDDKDALTMCYPINFKLDVKTELIVNCDFPPYLDTIVNYVVDTPFEKTLVSGQIQCLDGALAFVLASNNIVNAVKLILEAFVISDLDEVKTACGGGICAIGNSCNTPSKSCH